MNRAVIDPIAEMNDLLWGTLEKNSISMACLHVLLLGGKGHLFVVDLQSLHAPVLRIFEKANLRLGHPDWAALLCYRTKQ